MKDDNIVGWFSLENGQHIPLREGESKAEATRNFLKNKMSRVERNKSKYEKIDNFKRKKESNKLKKEEDEEIEYLDLNEEPEFKINEDDTKWKLRDDVRKQYEEELGLNKYQKNEKIKEWVWQDNVGIPIREGEDKEEVLRQYKEREFPEYTHNIKKAQDNEKAMQQGIHTGMYDDEKIAEAQKRKDELTQFDRRGALMKFTQDNKEQIDKWVKEYDDETHKRVGEKVLNKQPLTAKEYFGFLGSDMKPGSVILEEFPDGEDAVVANDGKWVRQSRIKEYNKNPQANQDAVFTRKDEEEYKRENARKLEQIQEFKKRKATNK